jgi:hypothetical protein
MNKTSYNRCLAKRLDKYARVSRFVKHQTVSVHNEVRIRATIIQLLVLLNEVVHNNQYNILRYMVNQNIYINFDKLIRKPDT